MTQKKKSNNYFTEDTEDAIIEYINSVDQIERNIIYNTRINYAFNKLAENIIHTFKFYYTDVNSMSELKHEVVTFLLSKLHKYKKSNGKAYSYFGTIAKRYLILYNEKNYKKLTEKGTLEEVDEDKKVFNNIMNADISKDIYNFMNLYIQYVDKHANKIFPKEIDYKIAMAILELFNKRENLDIFNKKALFIYIKEMIDVKTPYITKIIKKLKELYKKLYNYYFEHGDIDINKKFY